MISEESNKGAAIIKLQLYFSGCKYTTSHVPNEQQHSFFFFVEKLNSADFHLEFRAEPRRLYLQKKKENVESHTNITLFDHHL